MVNRAEGGAGGAGPTVEAVHPEHQDPLIGRTLDGRYRIHSLIAAGGMGRVYVADQLSLGRKVAVKVLALSQMHIRSDAQFLQRFTHEAATASRVNSPNAVTIFDFGHTDDDLYYLVMEYVEGKTLAQILRKERMFGPARTIRVAIQIALALKEAHRHGIVHRDIKPGNLVLCAPAHELVKVLDFGIAKLVERDNTEAMANLTASGTFVGTPEYCAPEALMGHADQRSDLYSLGVVMYLMLQGKLPFKGESPAETISMVLNDPVPLMDAGPDIPPALEAVVMRLLENRAEMRFQTVDHLLQALEVVIRQLALDVRVSGIGEIPPGVTQAEHELELQPATGVFGEDARGARSRPRWPAWLSTRTQRTAFAVSVLGVWLLGGALLVYLNVSSGPGDAFEDRVQKLAPASAQTAESSVQPGTNSVESILPAANATSGTPNGDSNQGGNPIPLGHEEMPLNSHKKQLELDSVVPPQQTYDTNQQSNRNAAGEVTNSADSADPSSIRSTASIKTRATQPEQAPRVEVPKSVQSTSQPEPPSRGSEENGYKPSPY